MDECTTEIIWSEVDSNIEFNYLEAAKECAEYTPGPTPEELARRKAIARITVRRGAAIYRKRHPDIIKMRSKVTSARNRSTATDNPDDLTRADIELQLKTQKGLCWWCEKPLGDDWQVDHRVALINGGKNNAGNIVCACKACNQSKKERPSWVFCGRLV